MFGLGVLSNNQRQRTEYILCHGNTLRVLTLRDNEDAYVSVNGRTCWSMPGLVGTSGSQECGRVWRAFQEERFEVTGCYMTLDASTRLTVRAWANLNTGALDESFAIDNVVIQLIDKYDPAATNSATANSAITTTPNFVGWNCGKISTCGDFGTVCGGYGVKGTGSDIKKTFVLPAGIYSVQLDFIRIDSWFVSVCSNIFFIMVVL